MTFKVLLQEQNKDVARKLGIATTLMFTLPFIVFFICQSFVFSHKEFPDAWSGVCAVMSANVIIAGYVYSAFTEDEEEQKKSEESAEDDNDASGPRVGVFKKRTD